VSGWEGVLVYRQMFDGCAARTGNTEFLEQGRGVGVGFRREGNGNALACQPEGLVRLLKKRGGKSRNAKGGGIWRT